MTKKTTTKDKSPAPATVALKPTRKTASKASTAKATPAAVPLAGAPAASPAPAAPAKSSHSVPTILQPSLAAPLKAVSPAKVQTKIVVRFDVGFGNALFLRGDGPGLSWHRGVPMQCLAADHWEFALGESARPIAFKVLVNDQVWNAGADHIVASGSTVTIVPEFA